MKMGIDEKMVHLFRFSDYVPSAYYHSMVMKPPTFTPVTSWSILKP